MRTGGLFYRRRLSLLSIIGAMTLAATGTAGAVPLRLEYTVEDVGAGQYAYDFSLILDNNDGSWVAGQQWDWFIFGDMPGFLAISPLADFALSSVDPGFNFGFTTGEHNGPTIIFGPSAFLPGWEPVSIGDAFNWSGTSSVLLGSGDLLWTTGFSSSGAVRANFATASLTTTTIPEPSTLSPFMAGLVGLGVMVWRRRRACYAS
jgi:hypothetical protein